MCLAALLCEQFWDQVLLHEIIFFLSVFSSSEVLTQIISSIRSKLPTAACWSREKKREENVKPTRFMSKATSVSQTPQTNHSQYSSPFEALTLIVESAR